MHSENDFIGTLVYRLEEAEMEMLVEVGSATRELGTLMCAGKCACAALDPFGSVTAMVLVSVLQVVLEVSLIFRYISPFTREVQSVISLETAFTFSALDKDSGVGCGRGDSSEWGSKKNYWLTE